MMAPEFHREVEPDPPTGDGLMRARRSSWRMPDLHTLLIDLTSACLQLIGLAWLVAAALVPFLPTA